MKKIGGYWTGGELAIKKKKKTHKTNNKPKVLSGFLVGLVDQNECFIFKSIHIRGMPNVTKL